MSIKPVDLQVMVSRASEVERVQQIQEQQARTGQQTFLIQNQVQMARQQEQVQKTPTVAQSRVEREGHRRESKGEGERGAGRKQAEARKEKQGLAEEEKGSHPSQQEVGGHIDVKI
ncbi:MAG: hypothetical protein QJR13_05470 [Bacillota bacterium]|nr:hypothetical protein [Bacillota bacterium]